MTAVPDRIRELGDAVQSQDWEALSERMHQEVVWRHNIGIGTIEEGEYEGRDNVLALFERILEPWEYMRVTPSEVRELGDGDYLVLGELRAKHKADETELATPYEQRLEFRGGLLVRGEMVSAPGAHLGER